MSECNARPLSSAFANTERECLSDWLLAGHWFAVRSRRSCILGTSSCSFTSIRAFCGSGHGSAGLIENAQDTRSGTRNLRRRRGPRTNAQPRVAQSSRCPRQRYRPLYRRRRLAVIVATRKGLSPSRLEGARGLRRPHQIIARHLFALHAAEECHLPTAESSCLPASRSLVRALHGCAFLRLLASFSHR